MFAALAYAPGGAGKIAKPIHRDDYCLLERRDVKGRGEMGEMMLDPMHLPAKLSRWGNSHPKALQCSDALAGS